jgi:hypothetical protein
LGESNVGVQLPKQREIARVVMAYTDTDFAGCTPSRKSTSGGALMIGCLCIKSWSVNQSGIALSSGEAEYYGMVKGASVALGLEAVASDLGVQHHVQVLTDACAAIAVAKRRGIGRIRHIEVSQLLLRRKVGCGAIVVKKMNGCRNPLILCSSS